MYYNYNAFNLGIAIELSCLSLYIIFGGDAALSKSKVLLHFTGELEHNIIFPAIFGHI